MKKIVLALAVCSVFSACGKHKNNNPFVNIDQAAKDKDLQGKNFASACQLQPIDAVLTGLFSGGQASVKSEKIVYRFDGANITRTTNLFTSPDCSGDTAVEFEEAGDFSLHPDQRTNDLGKFIDIDYKNLQVKVVTDEGAKAANAVHLCGNTDWAPDGKQRDVTAASAGLNCYSAGLPRHNSNVYRVDANVLYFGSETKASNDASDRPTGLDMNTKFTEQ